MSAFCGLVSRHLASKTLLVNWLLSTFYTDLRLQDSINLLWQITAETLQGAGGTHRSYKGHFYHKAWMDIFWFSFNPHTEFWGHMRSWNDVFVNIFRSSPFHQRCQRSYCRVKKDPKSWQCVFLGPVWRFKIDIDIFIIIQYIICSLLHWVPPTYP